MRHLLLVPLLSACAPPVLDSAQLPELPEGWSEIDPGGETLCARGTDYSFFVFKGSVNKVMVDFIGGGACWDEVTCGYSGALFADDMDWMRDMMDEDLTGIYDKYNEENPFKDWYHVIVPYCTGDIHWGDSVMTYGEGADEVTIHHKGAVNSRAVLDWVEAGFGGPEQIFVTGCSAGAYGSIMWAPHLQQMYPEARVTQLGDSGAGVVTDTWFAESFPSWNPDGAFPSWIPNLSPETTSYTNLALPDLYERIGAYYPQMFLSQFNTLLDWNQVLYYEAMGGGDQWAWSERMRSYEDRIDSSTPNFSHFLGPGDHHCILPYDEFYTAEAGGVKLTDWVSGLVNNNAADTVICEECE